MDKVAEYFDGLADSWESTLCVPSPVQPTVACIAGVGCGSRVLDVGCGTGVMAPIYLRLGVREVVALDIAPRMI
jgi:ribosomal protein L11 methylase PrmA